jgi:hypothetical protein
MENMYLVWYVIVCGRNGESYDSSSCTWSICILAGTLFKNLWKKGIMITRNGTDVVICETDIPLQLIKWDSCCSILSFMCNVLCILLSFFFWPLWMFCGRLFFLSVCFWPLYWLFFLYLRLLITPSIFIVFQVNPCDMLLFVHIYLTAPSDNKLGLN